MHEDGHHVNGLGVLIVGVSHIGWRNEDGVDVAGAHRPQECNISKLGAHQSKIWMMQLEVLMDAFVKETHDHAAVDLYGT